MVERDFFGEFLVEQKVVTEDDLARALEKQRRSRTPIGQIALKKKYLTEKEIIRVLTQQKNSNGRRRFGDIGVELSLLTEQQVGDLLMTQEQSGQFIGEILVDQNVLTKIQMIKSLRKFGVTHKE